MIKKSFFSILLSIGLLSSQPCFAMERDSSADNSHLVFSALLTFATFLQINYANLRDLLENNNPFYYDNAEGSAQELTPTNNLFGTIYNALSHPVSYTHHEDDGLTLNLVLVTPNNFQQFLDYFRSESRLQRALEYYATGSVEQLPDIQEILGMDVTAEQLSSFCERHLA